MLKNRQRKIEFQLTEGTQSTKLIQIQKPRGHKEERASFPDQFHTRVSKIHIPKILILERKEGKGRRRKRRLGERGEAASGRQAKRRETVPGARERERG